MTYKNVFVRTHFVKKEALQMDFQIRQAIAANVAGSDATEFQDIVNDAISRGEEHLLPGLGVFLEKWWQAANEQDRTDFAQTLAKQFAH